MPEPGTVPSRTIPQVLTDAAARDPDGVWVRSDEGTLSFAGALGQVTAAARQLRDAGVGHGDLVMVRVVGTSMIDSAFRRDSRPIAHYDHVAHDRHPGPSPGHLQPP